MRGYATNGRRVIILADGHLDSHFGKTTIGVVRYRSEDILAVVDGVNAGHMVSQVLGIGGEVPIVGTLAEALVFGPDTLMIGVATRGGTIPAEWRPVLREAIEAGLDIISGLHQFLGEDRELSAAALDAGVDLIDVRRPEPNLRVASGARHREESTVVTVVGSDCAVGKMSVALDVEAEAKARGLAVAFVATGQTGMMIAGGGIPLDRIIGDFMSGAMEEQVIQAAAEHEIVVVEGQGSLLHPAYSGVTLALIHGSRPDAMILTIMPTRTCVEDYDVPIPPVLELIEIHEAAAAWISPAPVIGIAVNTRGMAEHEARHVISQVEAQTGLPATDTFRFGSGPLVEAVEEFHRRRLSVPAGAGDERRVSSVARRTGPQVPMRPGSML